LIAEPEVMIEIGGHTDNTGSRATNLALSQRRAESVRAYLIQRGVPGHRLISRGYGPDSQITSNASAAGRSQNRRVELRRIN
jgi:OOP family OmpA-OmpF porin